MRILALFLLLVLLPACGGSPEGDSPSGPAPSGTGPALPPLTMKGADGGAVELRPGEGPALTLVEAWSPTWFPEAERQLQQLVELHERWGNRGVRVLAVAYDEEPEAVARALEGQGVLFEVAMGDTATWEALKVEALPTTWLVDRKGRVVEKLEGYQPLETLEVKLRKLLGPVKE